MLKVFWFIKVLNLKPGPVQSTGSRMLREEIFDFLLSLTVLK